MLDIPSSPAPPRPANPSGPDGRSCSACKWSAKNRNDITGRALECRIDPPATFPIHTNQGPAFMTAAPGVQPHEWCSRFTAAIAH